MASGALSVPRKYVAKLNETNSALRFAGAALAAGRCRAYGHGRNALAVFQVGAWPFDPAGGASTFGERLRKYFTKALREANVNTGWLSPDAEYEAKVLRFGAEPPWST
jgi:maltooligosyltrehalose synthase